jgi:hypothetical protein
MVTNQRERQETKNRRNDKVWIDRMATASSYSSEFFRTTLQFQGLNDHHGRPRPRPLAQFLVPHPPKFRFLVVLRRSKGQEQCKFEAFDSLRAFSTFIYTWSHVDKETRLSVYLHCQ